MDRVQIATLAHAYERIPYHLVLTAMVKRYFWGEIAAPDVVFRNLRAEHPACVYATCDPVTDQTGWEIALDSYGLAEWLGPAGIPITAVLAHELVHIFRREVEGLRGKHGRGFDSLCEIIASNGTPVTGSASYHHPALWGAPRCEWRMALAIERHTPMAIEKAA